VDGILAGLAEVSVGISLKRRDWVIDGITSVLVDGSVDRAHFRAGLGRLGFVCGAVVFVRPFSRPTVHMGRDEGWRFASTASSVRPLHSSLP
jgi:hypothetical protein